jgi:hypothetical protein
MKKRFDIKIIKIINDKPQWSIVNRSYLLYVKDVFEADNLGKKLIGESEAYYVVQLDE